MKSTSLYQVVGVLMLIGCASTQEWKLPTEGFVKQPPQELSKCIQDEFLKHQVTYNLKTQQRITRNSSSEIFWDHLSSDKVLLHRIAITKATDSVGSTYRVDAVSMIGLKGLGQIEVCFQ